MKSFISRVGFLVCLMTAVLSACSTPEFVEEDRETTSKENPDIQRRAAIRLQLAIEYYQQNQHKLALEEIRSVLLISPGLLEAYSLRALIHMDTGDIQRAEENFVHALKLAPNNSEVANNYGWFLCQNGREKQAMGYFEKVLSDRTYPTPVKAMSNAGVCSLRLKDINNAERYFLLAYAEDPGNPSLNANLAKVYHDKAQYEKAKFYIRRVLKDEIFAVDVLWLAIKIENKLSDQAAVDGLATQLRRRYPNSKEYALFQRGAFNE
ncbi:MAG: type IV pilus biogenesis/stability protein PilW [Undibacterium sp.]|nr:type IV pilus biogenesis/stability protein PilW [Undibacterium sp.]